MTKHGMGKKEEKGRVVTLKAKRLRVNKPGILREKQSHGNTGCFHGNFFQIKRSKRDGLTETQSSCLTTSKSQVK